jgi:ribosomal protein L7/L12
MEVNNMETLKCPSCGSNNLNQLGPVEYKCPHCGTGFMLTYNPTDFVDVVLLQSGNKKTDVILALREVTAQEASIKMIDLMMAKQLTDATPCIIAPNVALEVGERVKVRLEKAGATVELKPA